MAHNSHSLNPNFSFYSCLFKRGKIFGFVPNLERGNDMKQLLFDLRFRSFVWRFLCLLSSFVAPSATVHPHGKYVMCLCVIPDWDFNSTLLLFSYSTLTLHYALVIWNVACRDSQIWVSHNWITPSSALTIQGPLTLCTVITAVQASLAFKPLSALSVETTTTDAN